MKKPIKTKKQGFQQNLPLFFFFPTVFFVILILNRNLQKYNEMFCFWFKTACIIFHTQHNLWLKNVRFFSGYFVLWILVNNSFKVFWRDIVVTKNHKNKGDLSRDQNFFSKITTKCCWWSVLQIWKKNVCSTNWSIRVQKQSH